jgi:hypothetical protein
LFIPSFDWKFINWNLKFIEFILEMTERGIFLSKILNGKMRKREREKCWFDVMYRNVVNRFILYTDNIPRSIPDEHLTTGLT